MQIVIDIPRKVYDALKHMDFDANLVVDEMRKSIANGTPLPKGHGRLGDLDALEKEIINGIKAGNYEEGYETFANINNMDDCVECVKYAPTIIKADKGE